MPEKEFNLRSLNPQRGDLVLLVDDDRAGGEFPLLLVFERFLPNISDSSNVGVTLLCKDSYHLNATEVRYLKPQDSFNNHQLHFPHPRTPSKSKLKYRADRGYVGMPGIIEALREMKGYLAYAELFDAQSRPRPS